MTYLPRQSRTAFTGTTRTIALFDLKLKGIPQLIALGEDFVKYQVFHEDGTEYLSLDDAEYGTIMMVDDIAMDGWFAMIQMPDDPEKLKIVWSYSFGGVYEYEVDYIQVKAP